MHAGNRNCLTHCQLQLHQPLSFCQLPCPACRVWPSSPWGAVLLPGTCMPASNSAQPAKTCPVLAEHQPGCHTRWQHHPAGSNVCACTAGSYTEASLWTIRTCHHRHPAGEICQPVSAGHHTGLVYLTWCLGCAGADHAKCLVGKTPGGLKQCHCSRVKCVVAMHVHADSRAFKSSGSG